MTVQFFIAPAGAGKTAYVLNLVREASQGLCASPRVVVPTLLQVNSWRQRLAESGGAMGVRVQTFLGLYTDCLNAAGENYAELGEPVQYRLIRAILDALPLKYYQPLTRRPGFIQLVRQMIAELKAGMILPEQFSEAVRSLGDESRLLELADIYAAYQARLQENQWADRAGLGWLAVEALQERAPEVGRDWQLLVCDGFDNLTPVQLALLRIVATRTKRTVLTLTADTGGEVRALAHRRFTETRRLWEDTFGIRAEPLPETNTRHAPPLAHLEAHLFKSGAPSMAGHGVIELIEAPDREGEVRAALRWLKRYLVHEKGRPGEVAMLARAVQPYRSYIAQTAAEFGLPIKLVDGLPLRNNPAVVALIDLMRLMLPVDRNTTEPSLPRRLVVEAWHSPYVDWSGIDAESDAGPEAITHQDADALDRVARWGRVIGGYNQWIEVLDDFCQLPSPTDDAERDPESVLPVGPGAQLLREKFHRFVERLTPPSGERPFRHFVGWLESLIGPDSDLQGGARDLISLRMVERIRMEEETNERDIAALQALKDVLRGLVWAEEALGEKRVDFPRFFEELVGAIDATSYTSNSQRYREEILVSDVIQARGIPFQAVALIGLAEGEFPAILTEDPLLSDLDRQKLRKEHGLPLEFKTKSAEAEFFYESVTRPRSCLLLTRPRLAVNGALWQASPFWEALCQVISVHPARMTSQSVPEPTQVASWPELMWSVTAFRMDDVLVEWIQQQNPGRYEALEGATRILQMRQYAAPRSPFDGDLSNLGPLFTRRYGPDHPWSASRLESYRTCPFFFFMGSVLGLEPRLDPIEGLDARQMGNIYHRIFEHLYRECASKGSGELFSVLDEVAKAILDSAPTREGFRETAWWDQTRAEIIENVRRSIVELEALSDEFAPYQQEATFGLGGKPFLVVRDRDDRFLLRGFIDRLDRTGDGRVRVIDYKTGGPTGYDHRAVKEGRKLQLPLYALAARDALNEGEPVEGFYWHVRHAAASPFSLRGFEGGPDEAMAVAVEWAWEAIRGARRGDFMPNSPAMGCPSYCPAAAFCWHYRPGYWG